jgi:hypothetical protein
VDIINGIETNAGKYLQISKNSNQIITNKIANWIIGSTNIGIFNCRSIIMNVGYGKVLVPPRKPDGKLKLK